MLKPLKSLLNALYEHFVILSTFTMHAYIMHA